MSETKKRWPSLGSIRKGDNGSYIQVADNVTIYVDGVEVIPKKSKAGKVNLTLESPVAKCERFISLGFTKEEDVESSRAKAQGINEWLLYDIAIPLPVEG